MNSKHQTAAATIQQFAEALGVSRWTIHRLISRGEIHSTKIGRARRIPWSEVDRVLRAHEVPTGNHGPSKREAAQ